MHDHRGDAAQPLVHRRRHRGGRGRWRRPVNCHHDVGTGDVGERVGGHDHVVGDPEQQRRARTPPGRRAGARSAPHPTRRTAPWRRGPTRGARRRPRSRRRPSWRPARRPGCRASTARRTARVDRLTLGGADRAAVLAAVEVEPAHQAAVELAQGRIDRLAPVPEDRCRRLQARSLGGGSTPPARGSAWRCDRRTRTSSTAPAPARSAAARRRRRRDRSRRRSARGWRSAGRARPAATAARSTASAAPAAPIMWPVTPFVEVTGGSVVAEHLADRLRLRRVVQRRGRAVRVDVADRPRRRGPASSSASCMQTAAPAPPGDGAVMWYASPLRP